MNGTQKLLQFLLDTLEGKTEQSFESSVLLYKNLVGCKLKEPCTVGHHYLMLATTGRFTLKLTFKKKNSSKAPFSAPDCPPDRPWLSVREKTGKHSMLI